MKKVDGIMDLFGYHDTESLFNWIESNPYITKWGETENKNNTVFDLNQFTYPYKHERLFQGMK
jgi:hypothetical protein